MQAFMGPSPSALDRPVQFQDLQVMAFQSLQRGCTLQQAVDQVCGIIRGSPLSEIEKLVREIKQLPGASGNRENMVFQNSLRDGIIKAASHKIWELEEKEYARLIYNGQLPAALVKARTIELPEIKALAYEMIVWTYFNRGDLKTASDIIPEMPESEVKYKLAAQARGLEIPLDLSFSEYVTLFKKELETSKRHFASTRYIMEPFNKMTLEALESLQKAGKECSERHEIDYDLVFAEDSAKGEIIIKDIVVTYESRTLSVIESVLDLKKHSKILDLLKQDQIEEATNYLSKMSPQAALTSKARAAIVNYYKSKDSANKS